MTNPNPAEAARAASHAIGDSIADNLGDAFEQLANVLARVLREQAELRDELHTLDRSLAARWGDLETHIRQFHGG